MIFLICCILIEMAILLLQLDCFKTHSKLGVSICYVYVSFITHDRSWHRSYAEIGVCYDLGHERSKCFAPSFEWVGLSLRRAVRDSASTPSRYLGLSVTVPYNSMPGRINVPANIVQRRRCIDSSKCLQELRGSPICWAEPKTHVVARIAHSVPRNIQGQSVSTSTLHTSS